MNVKEGRLAIKKQIDKIEDEGLIVLLHKMINDTFCLYYESSLEPMSIDELRRRALLSQQDILTGKTLTLGDLRRDSENW